MQNEAADALIDLLAVHGEVFPHANPDNVKFTERDLAIVALFRRELQQFETRMKWRTSRTADPE